MSSIIGLTPTYGHDFCATLIKDGKILFTLEEDKLTGQKSNVIVDSFPIKSMESITANYGITLENCDHIAIARPYSFDFFPKRFRTDSVAKKIKSYSHHQCHTYGSYFTSGMEGKVITMSLDGSGIRSRSKIYKCDDNVPDLIASSWFPTAYSIANIYGCATQHLGWKILKDEGKTVGLAAHGKVNQRVYNYLKTNVKLDGLIHKSSDWYSVFQYFCDKLGKEGWFEKEDLRADFAATVQKFAEDIVMELLTEIKRRYPDYNKLCLSGGLFANVKINQRINESNLFDEIFIHQAMGDSGLAVGAAISKALELGEITKPFKQDNVYLGESFSKELWLQELSKHQDIEISIFSPNKVASLINGGAIVGIFMGRTEYGPRALGNRSIVVRPTDPETHKKLNERLKRTEIMPFAPSVLSEYADQIFHCDKSKYSAEFMTLCFNTRKEWLNKIPAVVHRIDGTSRPHIVKKSANPIYHSIIEEYRKLSGFPIVLNTSFNAHGEPINNYPHQVLKHLKDGSVDCIATEDFILYKKK